MLLQMWMDLMRWSRRWQPSGAGLAKDLRSHRTVLVPASSVLGHTQRRSRRTETPERSTTWRGDP